MLTQAPGLHARSNTRPTLRASGLCALLSPLAARLAPEYSVRKPANANLDSRNTKKGDSENPDDTVLRQMFTELFEELHVRAKGSMARQDPSHTLQPTALIGEVYLRLQRSGRTEWTDRNHFLVSASKIMRSVLVDHFRAKKTIKRESEREFLDLDYIAETFNEKGMDLDRLDAALKELESEQPEMARAVQLRFFGGLSMTETAEVLGMTLGTLEGRWYTVRAWLKRQMG